MANTFASNESRLEGLNYDVLEQILQHLPLSSLLSVCHASSNAANAIAERVIQKYHLDFDYLNQFIPTQGIFELFGANMRSIKIAQNNIVTREGSSALDELLRIIAEHALPSEQPSKLHNLIMQQINVPLSWNPTLLIHTQDYFVNLRAIDVGLVDHKSDTNYDLFFDIITKKANNLESITLRGLKMAGNFFDNLHDLDELCLFNTIIEVEPLFRFLNKRPNLRRFLRYHPMEDEQIIQAVTENCPNIEVIQDIHEFATSTQLVSGRYASLARLQHLRSVGITMHTYTGSDIIDIITEFCGSNTIETLLINAANHETLIKCRQLATNRYIRRCASKFTQLHTLGISNLTPEMLRYFLGDFIAPLKNLSNLKLDGNYIGRGHIDYYASANKNVSRIDVSGIEIDDLSTEIRNHGNKRDCASVFGVSDKQLTVVLNERQWKAITDAGISSKIEIILKK